MWIKDSTSLLALGCTQLPIVYGGQAFGSGSPSKAAIWQVGGALVAEMEGVILRDEKDKQKEGELILIKDFLKDKKKPSAVDNKIFGQFLQKVAKYFIWEEQLWRWWANGNHQRVPAEDRRYDIIWQAHDKLGHKGVFLVMGWLRNWFWCPRMEKDVKWYIRTCHECQVQQMHQIHIPLTVPTPVTYQCVYIDTMHMPKESGFSYILHTHCSLLSYPEYHILQVKNAKMIANFIFELICQWGAIYEVVTDNAPVMVVAVKDCQDQYGTHVICISPYNLQANGPIERRHRDVQEAIMKKAGVTGRKWLEVVSLVFWAEHVMIQKSTRLLPYYIVHGVEPVLPFNIAKATYLSPVYTEKVQTADLLADQARALMKRDEDLAEVRKKVEVAR